MAIIQITSVYLDGIEFDVHFYLDKEENDKGIVLETARLQGRNWIEHLTDADMEFIEDEVLAQVRGDCYHEAV